ncbi:Arylsulfatase [Symmachiella dynata]|uniref:sulfatase-like hydrolase/transferase n=1 Tax=Symmachiella dynata TaxID=2527995 RepID=UPI00118BFFE4|nr:sulfatase-like hydrolase/transferase [Symmachiella dynata]QDT50341.1 Arylsulfatase [Symmachiella dynata]
MHRTRLVKTGLIIILLAGLPNLSFGKEAPQYRLPNIVLITADNLGYGDVGCYGNSTIKTPAMDRLATQGVRCTSFYTASPTCTVSRATLLTGRYPQRIGLNHQLSAKQNLGIGLRQSEKLIPQYLKPLGYATACFGKWNIGFAPGSRPTERGFDEFFGNASGNFDYYTHIYAGRNDLYRGTEPVKVKGYSTDLFADAACDFIGRHAESPFFLYLPFNAPHFPSARNKGPGEPNIWQAPATSLAAYGYAEDEADPQKRYHAVVTALDTGIDRVLKKLDALQLTNDTLVIFYSDNGAFMLPGRGLEVASNRPLRDGGITLWEGGIRVPCIVRWPGRLKPGSLSDQPWISLDILPFILAVAGGERPETPVLDGLDPLPELRDETRPSPRRFYWEFRGMQAVREGRYKWILPKRAKVAQLFDLSSDLSETVDLAATQPKVADSLRRAFAEWRSQFP